MRVASDACNDVPVRTHVLIHRFLNDFEDISAHITKYDAALKYIFFIFKNLFLLISAVNSYVLFTSDFPNALSQVLVFMLWLNQLALIYRFMSLAAIPRKRVSRLSASCSRCKCDCGSNCFGDSCQPCFAWSSEFDKQALSLKPICLTAAAATAVQLREAIEGETAY